MHVLGGSIIKIDAHTGDILSPEHESAWGLRCVALCCGVETTRNLGQHISV